MGPFVESRTGGGGRVGERGVSTECSVVASHWVSPAGSGSGRVVFPGCCSGMGLVFAGVDPSCRASVVFVVAGSLYLAGELGFRGVIALLRTPRHLCETKSDRR